MDATFRRRGHTAVTARTSVHRRLVKQAGLQELPPRARKTVKGVIDAGHVAAVRFTINGVYRGETRIQR